MTAPASSGVAPAHGEQRYWPEGFGVTPGGVLTVGGRPVTHWIEEAGGTPLFLYDSALIARRIEQLRAALPERVHLHYAIKANPMPDVVGFIAPLVDGLDIASAGELEIALSAGMEPRHISFAGPGKRDAELAAAIVAGVVVNLESEGEMRRLARLAKQLGKPASAAVRVNPDFELKGSGMRMGGGAKPFGVDAERVPAMLAELGQLGLQFEGFHIFTGSQNLSATALIEAQDKALTLAAELARHAPRPPRFVNIGGGFGIPYAPADKPLDLAAVGAALSARLDRLDVEIADSEIIIELGRYIVGEAGVYLTQVIDRKVSHGEVFLITDGGLHHQLAASGNFGQVIRRNYPVAVATRFSASPEETATIVGCLCTPLDRLAEKIQVPVVEPGEVIGVFLAGAYGLTASPVRFLGHPEPAERLV
ncbi:pyridoxal-dependent decarboxylase, exosortase A system-associated [Pedomonas mirosovicensis]|uniref:pyridoxal-dependent decarboxylase, exosortase A system-associated n=1 Tax=Pedomonas mirosovicensis TaxID=2908641 RepID=UPI0021681650|nr:pyridoxal-dependent decarboxylase, exosortase A system-associated [Pedomonas mirosovicensis]MCH8684315.1 pyridoxal-dependent decarboxylase, exosortase A system-associated [Pedomonas mirosovicensis]